MGAFKSIILLDTALVLANAATSLPAPALASDGLDLAPLKKGGFSPRDLYISIRATGAVTLAGAKVAAYFDGGWDYIAELHALADIALTAGVGYGEKLYDVSAFERLALVGTFAGTLTSKVYAIEGSN